MSQNGTLQPVLSHLFITAIFCCPRVTAFNYVGKISETSLDTLTPHTRTVLYIIYWKDIKLSAVILGVSLVILLTLTLNTFIHTLVLLLLSFMVVALTYIVTKVAIDSFYNKELQNPFKYVPYKISNYCAMKFGAVSMVLCYSSCS